MRRFPLLLSATLFSLALPLLATAQTAKDRWPVCLACHGQNGQSSTDGVPSLGGMPVFYTLGQLVMFRERIRLADPMNAMAAGLSDDDLRFLGDAVNHLPPPTPASPLPAAEEAEGAALINRYHCNSCHGADLAGQRTVPHIAGQREDYLAKSLLGYKNNTRHGYSPAMTEAAQDIDPADIPKLAHYVASFRPPN